jgi:hypothetical protein
MRAVVCLLMLTVCATEAAHALGFKARLARLEAVKTALALPLLQRYASVKSRVDCNQRKDKFAKIVCRDKLLREMELLYNRSGAYHFEDYCHTEIGDLAKYRAPRPDSCESNECIYEFFKEKIGASLGGFSPFPQTAAVDQPDCHASN